MYTRLLEKSISASSTWLNTRGVGLRSRYSPAVPNCRNISESLTKPSRLTLLLKAQFLNTLQNPNWIRTHTSTNSSFDRSFPGSRIIQADLWWSNFMRCASCMIGKKAMPKGRRHGRGFVGHWFYNSTNTSGQMFAHWTPGLNFAQWLEELSPFHRQPKNASR